MSRGPARVLCVGGLEPTGRAGLLADVWAVRACGGQPLVAATALTAQGGRRFALNPTPVRALGQQLDAALASGPVHAVKLGMVASRAQLRAVVARVAPLGVPVVVDPVVRSSRGERLSALSPADFLGLGRLGWVLTPNLDELGWLGRGGEALLAAGFSGVLLKSAEPATDVLFAPGARPRTFRGKPTQRDSAHHRGTGCRLAAGLATGLAQGRSLAASTARARGAVLEFLNLPIMRAS